MNSREQNKTFSESDARQEELHERIVQYLEREVELFGEWMIPMDLPVAIGMKMDRGTDPGPVIRRGDEKQSVHETASMKSIDPTKHASREENYTEGMQTAMEKKISADDQPGHRSEDALQAALTACTTLDELRELALHAEELKTDLEGTRLVFGAGNPAAGLMLIGEAPGYHEDRQGEPFVGQAGQLLNRILKAIRFEREEVYITNILKHRPPSNRDPLPAERQRSLPWLLRQIELVNPRLILCLGRVPAATLLGRDEPLQKLRGGFHPFMGRELAVTYHPAALLRNEKLKRPVWIDVQMVRRRYDEVTGPSSGV